MNAEEARTLSKSRRDRLNNLLDQCDFTMRIQIKNACDNGLNKAIYNVAMHYKNNTEQLVQEMARRLKKDGFKFTIDESTLTIEW